MNTKTNIAMHFIGIQENERAVFNRVISFNATHGLDTSQVDDINAADIIIVNQGSYLDIEPQITNKTCIVLTNDESSTSGDFQIIRPLMITKAMNSLSAAIENAKDQVNATSAANNNELIEVNIDNVAAETVKTTESTAQFSPSSHSKGSTHKALVIDDSAAIRKQLELELRDAGIDSDFAESGEDALEIIKDNHYDLIFLDIIMPGLDGYETCKAMRKEAEFKKTPIIMLSGKTSPLDEVQGVIAGATTYLTKPVKSDKLQETLNRVTKWIDNYAPERTEA